MIYRFRKHQAKQILIRYVNERWDKLNVDHPINFRLHFDWLIKCNQCCNFTMHVRQRSTLNEGTCRLTLVVWRVVNWKIFSQWILREKNISAINHRASETMWTFFSTWTWSPTRRKVVIIINIIIIIIAKILFINVRFITSRSCGSNEDAGQKMGTITAAWHLMWRRLKSDD